MQRLRHIPSHQSDNTARVDAGAEQCTDRHIAHQLPCYSAFKLVTELLFQSVERLHTSRLSIAIADIPIFAQLELAVSKNSPVGSRNLVYPLKQCLWLRNPEERHI